MNKLNHVILLLALACGAAEGRDLFKDGAAIQLGEVRIAGGFVASPPDGDYVHPAISPDAKSLAYSRVVVRGEQELTEVLVLPLGKKTLPHKLISERDSEKYAVYKSFVTNIQWRDARHVSVAISDGDVEGVDLLLDAQTGKVVSSKDTGGDGGGLVLPPEMELLKKQILAEFPHWAPEVLDQALGQGAVLVPGRGVILQRNYAGYDSNILLIDLRRKQERILLQPEGMGEGAFLMGGFVIGDEVMLLAGNDKGAWLFKLAKDETVSPLAYFRKTEWWARVSPKYLSRTEAIFNLTLNGTASRGDNPILYYSSERGLKKVADYPEVYDFDVSKNRQLMAVCFWENNHRKIHVVRIRNSGLELKGPSSN